MTLNKTLRVIIAFLIFIIFTLIMNRLYSYYSGSNIIIEVMLEKDVYHQGELLKFEVYIYTKEFFWGRAPLKGIDVAIQLVNPNNVTVYVDQAKSDDKGKVVFCTRISKYWINGTYKAYIATPGCIVVKKVGVG